MTESKSGFSVNKKNDKDDGGSSGGGAEKRKAPRAPLNMLVQYKIDSFDEFLSEYCLDMSIGGMFIRTDSPRTAGSLIYLQFTLKDGCKLIEGLARVVHVNSSDKENISGMGVEFINFDDDSLDLIEEIVADRLRRGHDAGKP